MSATIAAICSEIKPLLREKLFHPTFTTQSQLDSAVTKFEATCASGSADDPVARVNSALPELQVSNTAFWGDTERPLGALGALNATLSMFVDGERELWVFKNVMPGGIASKAGIVVGDILAAINGAPVTKMPTFLAGKPYLLTIVDRNNRQREVSLSDGKVVANNCPPMAPPPPPILSSIIRPGIGLLRISGFPGIIGFDFAHQLTRVVRHLQSDQCSRFIIDLRANHGGGLGSLRLMSLLTPQKVPVGYSLSRAARDAHRPQSALPVIDRIPNSKLGLWLMALKFKLFHKDRSLRLMTEGMSRPLQGRVAVLVDESTRGGAENVAAFAKENHLATIVGSATAGENLGAANFTVAQTYHLRIPLVGWFLPSGHIGKAVEPDDAVAPSFSALRQGTDEVLDRALELLQ
jgi:carboxyl-terminal processing protease